METILLVVLGVLIGTVCWLIYKYQQERNREKQEAETRYKHRNIN